MEPSPAGASAAEVRLKFWGVRGSIPTPGPGTVKFGGNTACIELRADGQHIILDAGSGLRPLGLDLVQEFGAQPLNLTLLLTHTHWDHIQGFPFFIPAYQPQHRIRIMGFEGARHSFQSTLAGQMESPYFPVALSEMPGHIAIEEQKESSFQVGAVGVQAWRTRHPGTAYGYRFTTSAGTICYAPDHECDGGIDEGLADFIQGADVAILDTQYTTAEYASKKGWGHSCVDDVVATAKKAGVRQLYLFHHDPAHNDEFIEDMIAHARKLAGRRGMEVDAAREGEEVVLA